MSFHRNGRQWLAIAIGAILVFTSLSVAFARGGASGSARPDQRNQSWVSAFWNPHIVHYAWCNCWSTEYDVEYDSLAVNPTILNNSPLKLSPPVGVVPKGDYITSVSYDTYSGTKLNGINVYTMSSDGRTATLAQHVAAPPGATGATAAIASGGSTGASIALTFTHKGRDLAGEWDLPPTDAIDFVAKPKSGACSNGYVSPPIILTGRLLNGNDQPESGAPVVMPCSDPYPSSITVKK